MGLRVNYGKLTGRTIARRCGSHVVHIGEVLPRMCCHLHGFPRMKTDNLDDLWVPHFKNSRTNWFKCLFGILSSIAIQCLCDVCTSHGDPCLGMLSDCYVCTSHGDPCLGMLSDMAIGRERGMGHFTLLPRETPKYEQHLHPPMDFIADPATFILVLS